MGGHPGSHHQRYQFILDHSVWHRGPSLWGFFYTQLLHSISARVSGIVFLCNLFGLCLFTVRFKYSFYAPGGSCAALCRSLHRLLAQGYNYRDDDDVVD